MTNHLRVFLTPAEYSALLDISQEELRTPADQARHMLRLELSRRGALNIESKVSPGMIQPEKHCKA